MVIADLCPDAEVSICVNGTPLWEYEENDYEALQHLPRNSVCRYVECTDNQIFEIHTDLRPGTYCSRSHVQWRFFVDGKRIDGRNFPSEQVEERGAYHVSRGARGDGGVVDRYCFSALDISTELSKSENNRNEDLGTIKVLLYHEDKEWRPAESDRHPQIDTFLGTHDESTGDIHPNTVPEKDVKGRAISHGVRFQQSARRRRPRRDSVVEELEDGEWGSRQPDQHPRGEPKMIAHPINRDRHKSFTFIFKYRTMRELKSLLIVRPTPTPSPTPATPFVFKSSPGPIDLCSEDERDPETMSREELLEVAKDFSESRSGIRESKRDRSVSRVRGRKKPAPSSYNPSEWTNAIYRADDGQEIEVMELND